MMKNFISDMFSLFKKSKSKQQYVDCVIRNQNGEVLMLERAFTDDFEPGKWGFPGGKVEEGENPQDAVKREVLEETGIDLFDTQAVCIKEVDGGIIYYFEALLSTGNTSTGEAILPTDIILDIDEHRGFEWIHPVEIKEKSLILDLGTYIEEDILNKLYPITFLKPKASNVEESIALTGSTDLENQWQVIVKAFDEGGIITEEEYLAARNKYTILKAEESFDIIVKGFDEGIVDEEQYLKAKSTRDEIVTKLVK